MTDKTSAGSSNSCAECSRLRRELWLLKNTAKQYSGELAEEVARLCVRALLGTSDETGEGYSQAYADQMREALLTIAVSSLTPDRVRQFAHKGLLPPAGAELKANQQQPPTAHWCGDPACSEVADPPPSNGGPAHGD